MSQFFYGILNIFRPAKFLQELTIHDHESLLQTKKKSVRSPIKILGECPLPTDQIPMKNLVSSTRLLL